MFELTQSPSAIILLVALLGLVLLQIAGDIRESRLHARARKLRSQSKHDPRSVVSVIVEARNSAVFQTLESLGENSYKHLEIIVSVNSKSKHLLAQLRRYQRSSSFKKFRIITACKGLSQAQFIEKYARGSLVVCLSCGDHVDPRFIADSIIHFRDSQLHAIAGSTSLLFGNSLTLAFVECRTLLTGYWRRIVAPTLFTDVRLKTSVIYRKNIITNKRSPQQPLNCCYIDKTFVTVSEIKNSSFSQRPQRFIPVLSCVAFACVVGWVEGVDQVLFMFRVLTGLALLLGLLVWRRGGILGLTTKLSLALLTPFTILWPRAYTNVDAKR